MSPRSPSPRRRRLVGLPHLVLLLPLLVPSAQARAGAPRRFRPAPASVAIRRLRAATTASASASAFATAVPEQRVAAPGDAVSVRRTADVAGRGFSVAIEPNGDASAGFLRRFMADNEDWLRDLLRRHGAVLLRGFDVPDAEAFNGVLPMQLGSDVTKGAFYDLLYKTVIASVFTLFKGLGNIDPRRSMNAGAGNRVQVLAPASDCIQGPHQESLTLASRLSQRYVAFHCETAPEARGETAIFDTHGAYEDLDADLREVLDTHDWRFRDVSGRPVRDLIPCVVNHDDGGKPCVQVYAFGEMGEAAAEVARGHFRRPNLRPDPYLYGVTGFTLVDRRTGEEREMGYPDRLRLMRALYANSELRRWRGGDIVLLDNVSVAHGRMDGTGARKINFCGICDYRFSVKDYPTPG